LPPRVAFFSHQRRTLLLLVYVFSFRHHSHSLSLRRRPILFRQHSLSLFRRSLAQSVCSDVPASLSHSLPLAARALMIALNFSPQKASAIAGQPAACVTTKGARADVDCAVLHAVAAAASPPPILLLLLGRARLVESSHQGGN
jgi:hypothetical protein